MSNISGFGFRVNIVASNTYPVGFVVTQFADDSDPFDLPSLQVADSAMGLNGDLIAWSKANPIKLTLNIIPDTLDDINFSILLEANRVGKGKTGARDVITMVGIYPSGRIITLSEGIITDGLPGNSIASSARLKSKSYSFAFENKAGI
jgi:hypothetical protein